MSLLAAIYRYSNKYKYEILHYLYGLFSVHLSLNPFLSHLENIMPLRVMIFIIVLIRGPVPAHYDLGQVQKFLPERDRGSPARRYRILLRNFSCSLVNVVEIRLYELALPLVVNPDVRLIVDFPAPPVVVHRPQSYVLAIKKVHFGVQHSLCGLVD